MMKLKIILLLVLKLSVSCFYACYAQDLIKTFNLTKLPEPSAVKLSDLGFVDIEYIPLETKEESLISEINTVFYNEWSINKILSGDGYFVIKNGKRVLKFKENGLFVTNIGRIGRGPDEINNIEDLDIDRDNQNIYMVSGWQKKFFLFSLNGELLKTYNVPFYIREFRFVGDKIICYCGNNRGDNKFNFVLTDKSGQIIKTFPNQYSFKPKSSYGFTHENLFYTYNKRLYIKELYSDTIFVFDNLGFDPHLVIEVGNRQVTPKVRSECNLNEICANYIQPENLLEFGDYVYYAFTYRFVDDDVVLYGFIGSKKNSYQVLFNLGEGIINDLDGGPNILPLTIKDENTIITIVDALKLKSHIASEGFKNSKPVYPEKKKELEELAASLKETDNPVLVLVRLKK